MQAQDELAFSRRQFTKTTLAAGVGAVLLPAAQAARAAEGEHLFKISLDEWSLHKALLAGKLKNIDFAKYSKDQFGIDAIEYVNQFFKDQANDKNYLADLNQRAADLNVKQVLIMCDGEGDLGDANLRKRMKAVENHYKWVEAAKTLGCHSIRVNAASSGSFQDQVYRAADGLRALTEFATDHEINVIVENHGGLSSNGQWLAQVMKTVDLPRCGTLPDFGNFNLGNGQEYDRYQGVTELMPFAKAVSAKSHDFDEQGNETHTDYQRMMKIVLDAGYHGYVGIEYEGEKMSEDVGIMATKVLLDRLLKKLA